VSTQWGRLLRDGSRAGDEAFRTLEPGIRIREDWLTAPPAASAGDAVAKAVTTSQQGDCVVVVAAIERLDDLEVRGDLASFPTNRD